MNWIKDENEGRRAEQNQARGSEQILLEQARLIMARAPHFWNALQRELGRCLDKYRAECAGQVVSLTQKDQRSLFIEKHTPPSASVLIFLNPSALTLEFSYYRSQDIYSRPTETPGSWKLLLDPGQNVWTGVSISQLSEFLLRPVLFPA
jgi:hypothetical protein